MQVKPGLKIKPLNGSVIVNEYRRVRNQYVELSENPKTKHLPVVRTLQQRLITLGWCLRPSDLNLEKLPKLLTIHPESLNVMKDMFG